MKVRITKDFFYGILYWVAIRSLQQDIMGQQAYIEWCKSSWIPAWIGVPIAIIAIILCIKHLIRKVKYMKITYCRTAYVMECPDEILNSIKNNMLVWEDSPRSICTAYENLISFLDDEDSKVEEELYKYLQEVKDNLEGEIGDIVFSR